MEDDMRTRKTRFQRWLAMQPRGTKARIMRETGCSTATLQRAQAGQRIERYAVAERLAAATKGAITAAEIAGAV